MPQSSSWLCQGRTEGRLVDNRNASFLLGVYFHSSDLDHRTDKIHRWQHIFRGIEQSNDHIERRLKLVLEGVAELDQNRYT